MNLAEIRKKAVETRKQDEPEVIDPSVHADVPEADSFPAGETFLAESAEFSLDEYDSSPPVEEESEALSSLPQHEEPHFPEDHVEGFEDVAPLPEEIEGLPDETVMNVTPEPASFVRETAPAVESTYRVAAPIRHPAYDPIATLLAGRESAASVEETPSDEEHFHVSGDLEEYLCFKVAHEEYALSIMDIKEIIKPREVTEVPRMPKFVSGVISLRGVIIPIMDMRLRLSLPVGEPTGRERVLVLRTTIGYCGVLVDEVIQVVRIHNSAIEGPPTILDGIDREFVMGLGRFDNRMLILLNLDSILNLDLH
jgi:purine-binding chemotaxis protein CheW